MSNSQYPVIIVVAFNRDGALNRILYSLKKAEYPNIPVTLIISIDKSENQQVLNVANEFNWEFGPKRIINQEENIGLRKHILKCGDLTNEYGSVIILEDDLLVSPSFYQYSVKAIEKYRNSSEIAGISLYQYQNNFITQIPHSIIDDGYSCYFMKVPSSWGQIWTREQWNSFKEWYDKGQTININDSLPLEVIAWPETSWKKYFWLYLTITDKYFVYPIKSYSTNTGELGEHHQFTTNIHQSDLSLKADHFLFPEYDETLNVYDQFFEILPVKINSLKNFNNDLTIDLNGIKPINQINTKYCLSIRRCKVPIMTFDIVMFPIQLNVIYNYYNNKNSGTIKLGLTKDFDSVIDERYIEQLSGRVDLKIRDFITEQSKMNVTKSDEYVIGTKWLNLIKTLPLPLQKTIKKTKLFNNPWK